MRDSLDLGSLCVPVTGTLRTAVTAIDRNQCGIALIVDGDRRLVGTITDGDARRAMLAGKSLDVPIRDILCQKKASPYPQPVTAEVGTDHATLVRMMQDLAVRQIPLLAPDGSVAGLVTLDELLPDQPPGLEAVIMAGGLGTRLMPLTEDTPKPMLPVGDRPVMELIIDQLRQAGIRRVNVTTHHRSDKIKAHFGDGHNHGVVLSYVDEERPLGTAGALALMEKPTQPLLVINGDIVTQVDFRAMLAFHREQGAEMTIGVRHYDMEVPYGVVECEAANVRKLTEKPHFDVLVNAGIYLLEPSVHELIPNNESSTMTDLIHKMLDAGRPVVSFPIREYWLDIGRHTDYEQAQQWAKGDKS